MEQQVEHAPAPRHPGKQPGPVGRDAAQAGERCEKRGERIRVHG